MLGKQTTTCLVVFVVCIPPCILLYLKLPIFRAGLGVQSCSVVIGRRDVGSIYGKAGTGCRVGDSTHAVSLLYQQQYVMMEGVDGMDAILSGGSAC